MDTNVNEPTVLSAAWRYRWLILAFVAVVVTVGIMVNRASPPEYSAEATLLVEDPRTSALFESGVISRPERYVSNQATILTSAALANAASELAAEEGVQVTPIEIVENLQVQFNEDSDEITVTFVADDPETAVVVTNAIASAYEGVRVSTASGAYDRAIEELENTVQDLDSRLAEIDGQIEGDLFSNPARVTLEEQYQAGLQRLAELQARVATATELELESLRGALDDIEQQLQTLQSLLTLEQNSPELASLRAEREQIAARIAELSARRDRLVVDASLGPTGIVLFSPAIVAEESGVSTTQLVLVSLVFSGVIGTIAAYLLAVRNRVFTERSQPEAVLKAPLLASVPDFREEKIGNLPVKQSPTSSAAEEFRFVVAALHRVSMAGKPAMRSRDSVLRSFVVLSAAAGDGKSVITANLALAAAQQQMRVLVIDADFGDQGVTRFLTSLSAGPDGSLMSRPQSLGLTNMIEDGVPLDQVLTEIRVEGFPEVELLSRGSASVTAPEFFGKDRVADFFRDVREDYDVVLIDAPPLLQVAYASSLAHLGDRSLVVIPHRSSVGRAEELADRLEFTNSTALGYIYTKAPLRVDLPLTEGSMQDILGRGARVSR